MNEFIPSEFFLSQNYPDPFKEKTVIKYCVAFKTRVLITVYNAEGKEIEKLVDEEKKPGTYEVEFYAFACHSGLPPERDGQSADGGRNLEAGIYYYRLEAGNYTSEKNMIFQK